MVNNLSAFVGIAALSFQKQSCFNISKYAKLWLTLEIRQNCRWSTKCESPTTGLFIGTLSSGFWILCLLDCPLWVMLWLMAK